MHVRLTLEMHYVVCISVLWARYTTNKRHLLMSIDWIVSLDEETSILPLISANLIRSFAFYLSFSLE